MVEDIVKALERQGIQKVVLLVAHGGNWVLKPTIREIDLARTGVKVVLVPPEFITIGPTTMADLHAGQTETSLILHLHPEHVKSDADGPGLRARSRAASSWTIPACARPARPASGALPARAPRRKASSSWRRPRARAVDYIKKTFADFERLMGE